MKLRRTKGKKTGRRKSAPPPAPPRRARVSASSRSRLCVAAAVVLIVALAVFFLLRAPFFAVTEIQVTNTHDYAPEEIVSLSGLEPGGNIFLAPLAAAREKLLAEKNIRDVFIRRIYPGIVHVTVFEREPRARLRHGRGDVLEETIDEQAEILGELKRRPHERLPEVTGLEVDSGRVVPEQEKAELILLLSALDRSGIEKLLRIEEIRMGEERKLVLVAEGMEITMKRGQYPEQLGRLKIVLNRVKVNGQGEPASIDLRPVRVPVTFH